MMHQFQWFHLLTDLLKLASRMAVLFLSRCATNGFMDGFTFVFLTEVSFRTEYFCREECEASIEGWK